jgi:hypothetical protein
MPKSPHGKEAEKRLRRRRGCTGKHPRRPRLQRAHMGRRRCGARRGRRRPPSCRGLKEKAEEGRWTWPSYPTPAYPNSPRTAPRWWSNLEPFACVSMCGTAAWSHPWSGGHCSTDATATPPARNYNPAAPSRTSNVPRRQCPLGSQVDPQPPPCSTDMATDLRPCYIDSAADLGLLHRSGLCARPLPLPLPSSSDRRIKGGNSRLVASSIPVVLASSTMVSTNYFLERRGERICFDKSGSFQI